MSEQDFIGKANEVLDKIESRNKKAWNTIIFLALFLLGVMGTGIIKITTLENNKADKEMVDKVYLKINRYEEGQQMKSKLEAAYMAKMAAIAGGDMKLIREAEKEYNYHIMEIIKYSGTRGIK